MLTLAKVGPGDYVVDLGSGDGRLVTTAVSKYKARGGMGVEIDGKLVKEATANAAKTGVGDRVKFVEGDLFKANVGDATVVTLYLLPSMMGDVEAKLAKELKPGRGSCRTTIRCLPGSTSTSSHSTPTRKCRSRERLGPCCCSIACPPNRALAIPGDVRPLDDVAVTPRVRHDRRGNVRRRRRERLEREPAKRSLTSSTPSTIDLSFEQRPCRSRDRAAR